MSFLCPDCRSGNILPRRISGRKALATRSLEVELPADLELNTCDVCLSYTVTEDQEEAFEAAVKRSLELFKP